MRRRWSRPAWCLWNLGEIFVNSRAGVLYQKGITPPEELPTHSKTLGTSPDVREAEEHSFELPCKSDCYIDPDGEQVVEFTWGTQFDGENLVSIAPTEYLAKDCKYQGPSSRRLQSLHC